MQVERTSHAMPFSCESIFDLAADVERYPQFLRWWIGVRILERAPASLRVEQELGLGPARVRFISDATLERPRRIEVSSADEMFRDFKLQFTIVPAGKSGCTLHIDARLQMKTALLGLVVERALAASIDDMLAAFEARAQAVCAHAGGA